MENKTNAILKTLILETENLLKDLEKSSPLEIIDLSLPYNHMFSPAAKLGMKQKVTELSPQRKLNTITALPEQFVTDKVEYFGAVALGEEKLVKAARKVAEAINKYAAKGYVTGCLAPLSAIKIFTEPFQLQRFAVFCFVSLTQDGVIQAQVERLDVRMQEGEAPSLEV